MVSFDGHEIGWVIDSSHDLNSGTITYNCISFGNVRYTKPYQVLDAFKRNARFKGEKIIEGPFLVDLKDDEKLFVLGGEEKRGYLLGYDAISIATSKDRESLIFSRSDLSAYTGHHVGVPGRQLVFSYVPPTEITHICDVGMNEIRIHILNLRSSWIGTEDIYFVKTGGEDPREEIEFWQEYEADEVTLKTTIQSRRFLQSSGGFSRRLIDENNSWNAVLIDVSFTEDSKSDEHIFYSLTFYIGDVAYRDEYGKCYEVGQTYDNLTYYENYPLEGSMSRTLGEMVGYVSISENYPIEKVDIYGHGLNHASWIEVNNQKRYWQKTIQENVEKLNWTLPSPNNVRINSPNRSGTPVWNINGSRIVAICLHLKMEGAGIPRPTQTVRVQNPVNVPYDKHYYPPYRYNNVTRHRWTTGTSYVPPAYRSALGADRGNEIGIMQIREPFNVREVHIWGSGCVSPANITINGVTRTWNCYHDSGRRCNETLKFKISPNRTVNIRTGRHDVCPSNWSACNRGAFVGVVRVFYQR